MKPKDLRGKRILLIVSVAGLFLGNYGRLNRVQAQGVIALNGAQNQIQLHPQQVVSWVFSRHASLDTAKQACQDDLQTKIEFVNQACPLSAEQRSQLELAGQGDIHRFINRFSAFSREVPTGSVPLDEYQKLRAKSQPLQRDFAYGLHHTGSLFRKSLHSIFDQAQLQRVHEHDLARQKRHYISNVKAVIAVMEMEIPLTSAQREKLIELIVAQPALPELAMPSYYKTYLVFYQISRIPEAELKPIFLENEWPLIQGVQQQGQQIRQMLQQQGMLFD